MCRTNTEWEKVEEDMRRFYEDSFVLDSEGVDLTKKDPIWDSKRNSHLCKLEGLNFTFLSFISNLYLYLF